MRNMLAFFAAVVLTVAGVGFYLDWFNIRRSPNPEGHPSFTLDVNTDKISDDFRKAEEKLQKKLAEKVEKSRERQPSKTQDDHNIHEFIDRH